MRKILASILACQLAACGGGSSGTAANTSVSANPATPTGPVEASVTLSKGELINHVHARGSRQYSLFKPTNPTHEKRPLVIWFHGAGGTVWPGIKDDHWVQLAGRDKFYFLMPQAITDQYATYNYWNAGFGAPKDDIQVVTAALDEVIAGNDIDPDRIYVGGMSSGGHMAFYTALKLRERLAAVAPIAGSISVSPDVLSDYSLGKPLPLCHIHGTSDTIVSINGGDFYSSWSAIRSIWLRYNQVVSPPTVIELPDLDPTDGSTVTKIEYRGPGVASDIDDYRINGGGHSVPGINVGANQDINAYDVAWAFFQRHKLSDR